MQSTKHMSNKYTIISTQNHILAEHNNRSVARNHKRNIKTMLADMGILSNINNVHILQCNTKTGVMKVVR